MVRSMENISRSVENQGGAVNQERTSIEELNRNIAMITELSQSSTSISGNLDGIASEGITSVKQLIAIDCGTSTRNPKASSP